jgi:Leucine-rich repeat (LRR) protein
MVGSAFFLACGDSGPSGPDPLDAIASVTVSPPQATVDVGATTQLNATVKNGRGETMNSAVTWVSSTTATATVSSSGLVTGVLEGSSTITASAGGKSGTANVTVNDPFPPQAPSNVSAAPVSTTVIQVTWTDNSENEDDFRIDRELVVAGVGSEEVGPARVFEEVGSVGPNVTTFQDTGLQPGTDFKYRVRACNENGCSEPGADENVVATFKTLGISTASLPGGTVGVAYEQTLVAIGGDETYLWSVSAGNLPDGLSLNAGSGVLGGVPTAAGDFFFTAQVQTGDGQTATVDLSMEVVFIFSCAIQSEIPATECEALVAVYEGTNGPGWTNSTDWLASLTPCSWFGVTCGSGAVVRVELSNNGLTGSIPTAVGDLPSLQRLYLQGNQLGGPIPPEIGSLSVLTDLYLSANQLTGSIPSEIGNLSDLEWLYLQGNQLTGNVPSSLGGLSSLGYLDFSHNQLTGAIPAELGDLSAIKRLEITNNELTGSIPPELGNLLNLERLHLSNNQLGGGIPAQMGLLSKLERLFLTSNELTGNLPPELGNLTNLVYLSLAGNQLSGPIPPELGDLSNLEGISLQYNQLTGAIPSELGNLSNLGTITLQSNQLTGTIPPELGNLVNLQALSLQSNQLTGAIPPELGNLVNLRSFFLYSNQLNATIPLAVAQLGGVIQSTLGLASCDFLPGNAGLNLVENQDYRDADLDADGFICEVPFPPGPAQGLSLMPASQFYPVTPPASFDPSAPHPWPGVGRDRPPGPH